MTVPLQTFTGRPCIMHTNLLTHPSLRGCTQTTYWNISLEFPTNHGKEAVTRARRRAWVQAWMLFLPLPTLQRNPSPDFLHPSLAERHTLQHGNQIRTIFVNKVLLGHSYDCLFTYHLSDWQFVAHSGSDVKCLPQAYVSNSQPPAGSVIFEGCKDLKE